MIWLIYILLMWWVASFLPPKWIGIWKLPAIATTIAPFILYNPKTKHFYDEQRLQNHEMRHIWQQRILSPVIMLILYLIFSIVLFVIVFFKTFNIYEAYKLCYWNNPFEIDARKHEEI